MEIIPTFVTWRRVCGQSRRSSLRRLSHYTILTSWFGVRAPTAHSFPALFTYTRPKRLFYTQ